MKEKRVYPSTILHGVQSFEFKMTDTFFLRIHDFIYHPNRIEEKEYQKLFKEFTRSDDRVEAFKKIQQYLIEFAQSKGVTEIDWLKFSLGVIPPDFYLLHDKCENLSNYAAYEASCAFSQAREKMPEFGENEDYLYVLDPVSKEVHALIEHYHLNGFDRDFRDKLADWLSEGKGNEQIKALVKVLLAEYAGVVIQHYFNRPNMLVWKTLAGDGFGFRLSRVESCQITLSPEFLQDVNRDLDTLLSRPDSGGDRPSLADELTTFLRTRDIQRHDLDEKKVCTPHNKSLLKCVGLFAVITGAVCLGSTVYQCTRWGQCPGSGN